MDEPVVKLENVWKIFGSRAEEAMEAVRNEGIGKPEVLERFNCVVGVQGATFEVPRGEIFCIMGLSGSGKSTLVRHVNRLIEPTAGRIEILGHDVSKLSESELRRIRAQQIGMVFQHMALMPHRSVRDNVAYPLEIRKVSKSKRWAVSDHALSLVNLTGYEDRLPKELSGGMQQRVGIARALASDPEILLMDEPFSALDPLIRLQLQDQFKALVAQLKKTTLFITHDLDEAIRIGHRIAIMKDGVIVQIGTPEDIVMNPSDDYVREFVQGISKLKLVKAHSIMEPVGSYSGPLDGAPRADEGADLDQLIDLAVNSDLPVVITDAGIDVGVVTKPRLLRGIQGGKND
ncbi:betaine/proline/choline family ABC transporter ATP-binding protein [Ruegeria sp. HKCCD6228]|uniref:quaternary amine ABC transporter ATP-binding protein n=1 Tax=unclassified Ruegeria TaxID=2625375 RepID=UPI001488D219|nr:MULTISPECIES: glycine betaine/L-proline ABC transporter ATP-binding protein [unclassified Ruegeria]NOC83903.1 betaine/proline/choline family ABC transporter ATP-binding protein [Ruegeria sp. HKCCD6428]NOC91156.1 betaine/proline/choline family ABC transporter ATP-binding protein [Ruegeria sp. HKCCD6604]NOD95638.1 betaine/proline/choline family ABC transporter ATP-binding protein [Ruegeria sp. HKCCD6228]